MDSEDAGCAFLGREVGHFGTTVDERRQAVVTEADMLLCLGGSASGWVADGHSEALRNVNA